MNDDIISVTEMSFSGDDLLAGMEAFQKIRPARLKGLIELVEADYFGCTLHTGTVIGKNETSYVHDEYVLVYREYIYDDIKMLQDEVVHLRSFPSEHEANRWLTLKNSATFTGDPVRFIPLGMADLRNGYVDKFIPKTTYAKWDGDSLDSLIGLDEDYESYWWTRQ
jgi:hypothetical protein